MKRGGRDPIPEKEKENELSTSNTVIDLDPELVDDEHYENQPILREYFLVKIREIIIYIKFFNFSFENYSKDVNIIRIILKEIKDNILISEKLIVELNNLRNKFDQYEYFLNEIKKLKNYLNRLENKFVKIIVLESLKRQQKNKLYRQTKKRIKPKGNSRQTWSRKTTQTPSQTTQQSRSAGLSRAV
jgi:hypothetical protein